MYVVVLNDGTTFTDISGCLLIDVPDEFEETEDQERYIVDWAVRGLDIEAVLAVYLAVEKGIK